MTSWAHDFSSFVCWFDLFGVIVRRPGRLGDQERPLMVVDGDVVPFQCVIREFH